MSPVGRIQSLHAGSRRHVLPQPAIRQNEHGAGDTVGNVHDKGPREQHSICGSVPRGRIAVAGEDKERESDGARQSKEEDEGEFAPASGQDDGADCLAAIEDLRSAHPRGSEFARGAAGVQLALAGTGIVMLGNATFVQPEF